MIRVEFLGPIKKDDLEIKASNLAELKEILNKDESLKEWLEISAVAINDEIINSLDKELKNGDKVSILPPVCGG
ncbi:molybdopterin synthase, small subunit [Campylobacter ureolyticus RIGS 9880]|uniref:Molybdopterin synthase, small subunit n=1 Tax=Campylobacter ureolyticus RIGS 9880 TaxID=1032069 RepID=A0AAU8UB89_9BACT|nr:MoaD/ThiS family protein [Campylobacter ureolyticus]AKT90345.1 molybdopterin synthase, small subunit [Campylobacter ureolyticus RIGS 9880]MCZ6111235.1 MoaD/ThiS family protein [Campylobacter ureolyticus]MCZ6169056.1 MoaD/ThiS family protein [Campylobacter ureolyticus]MDK8322679.1 MoaD/ThiS family protein [Campylobacter ureolyticus]